MTTQMKEFSLRSDLTRAVVDGFAFPLGFTAGSMGAPRQGYTLAYTSGEGDDPDTYTFQIVVSHERLADLCRRCFELLPEKVYPIVEIGSRDAYRSLDVYLGRELVGRSDFIEVWDHYEPFLLEDGTIAAGANADEPFVEVFLDQRKAVVMHVPLSMRDDVESMLGRLGLEQVQETWPEMGPADEEAGPQLRPVLDVSDEFSPDVDELLLRLRHHWGLQLDLDPEANLDEAGRELGPTLWHAVVIVYSTENEDEGAYLSMWLTARSLSEAEQLIQDEVEDHPEWEFGDIYTVDRVAYDERPDELGSLQPKGGDPKVHLVTLEPWSEPEIS